MDVHEADVLLHLAHRGVEVDVRCDAQHHADVTEEGSDDDALYHNEAQDLAGLGADGLADAELARTLLYGDEHDVAHADDAAEQCEDADDPKCNLQNSVGLAHLQTS